MELFIWISLIEFKEREIPLQVSIEILKISLKSELTIINYSPMFVNLRR